MIHRNIHNSRRPQLWPFQQQIHRILNSQPFTLPDLLLTFSWREQSNAAPGLICGPCEALLKLFHMQAKNGPPYEMHLSERRLSAALCLCRPALTPQWLTITTQAGEQLKAGGLWGQCCDIVRLVAVDTRFDREAEQAIMLAQLRENPTIRLILGPCSAGKSLLLRELLVRFKLGTPASWYSSHRQKLWA